MTPALRDAVERIAALPAEEQDRIARWILEELRDEELWAKKFANSQEALSKLADEARAEIGDRPTK